MASVQSAPDNRELSNLEEGRTFCIKDYNFETETETTKQFTCIRRISSGKVANVLEGKLDEVPCVVRVYHGESCREDKEVTLIKDHFQDQVVLHTKLQEHPNIVKLLYHHTGLLALFLNKLPESLAEQKLNNVTLSTDDVTAIIYDVCSALAYLHGQGYTHNYLTAEHISYSPGRGAVLFQLARAAKIKEEDPFPFGGYPPRDVCQLGVAMLSALGKLETRSTEVRPIDGYVDHVMMINESRWKLDSNILVERIVNDMLHPISRRRITVSKILAELKDWNAKRSRE